MHVANALHVQVLYESIDFLRQILIYIFVLVNAHAVMFMY